MSVTSIPESVQLLGTGIEHDPEKAIDLSLRARSSQLPDKPRPVPRCLAGVEYDQWVKDPLGRESLILQILYPYENALLTPYLSALVQ
jgi:hypothetical protein